MLRERGALSAIKLFFAVQQMENPLFMGDLSFFAILYEMASVPHPLIEIENAGQVGSEGDKSSIAHSMIRITDTGLRVFQSQLDHMQLNGINRWLGGVHLTGAAAWRWDDHNRRLVGKSPI